MSEDDDIDRSVAAHGWHAIAVGDHVPPFLYTCGLLTRSNHPELVLFGVEKKTAYRVVAGCVRAIREGLVLEAGSRFEVPGGLVMVIGAVHPSQHEVYLGYAMAHARRHRTTLQALQVFWPDEAGRLPPQPRLELPRTVDG
jgi:hypothetical protein